MTHLADSDRSNLEKAFAAFASTAQGLEDAYQELRSRTERLDLELHEANQQLQALFAALPEGVAAADRDGIITSLNSTACRILGLAEDREGMLRTGDFRDRHDEPLFLPCQGPEDRQLVVDGVEARVRIRYVPLSSQGDALWILEDRTELEQLEGRVAHLDQLASLGRMSLSIAHEIRNPLNGVTGFAGLLRQRVDDPKAIRYCDRILEGVRRVDAIIRNLLAFARPANLVLRRVDLCQVITTTFEEWEGGRPEVILPEEPALIDGDSTAVRQVLENLLHNALEAGGAQVPIKVTLERGGGSWVLAVEDGGPGIPANLREAVFEPFRSEKEKGTGLGLAIVQRIVELHHGRVRAVEPMNWRGARFEVVLPAGGDCGR